MTCWGITDGSAGMVAQVRALASALDLKVDMKVVSLKKPWAMLPNIFYDWGLKNYVLGYALREKLPQPYPDIIISCGRKAALVGAAIKKENPQAKAIHIQDPQMSPANFDVVVAMEHDNISGNNVIKTRFALHSITAAKLDSAREKFTPLFSKYPKPRIAVLIGGSTNKYQLTKHRMQKLIADLKNINGSLLITPSRRTGVKNIIDLTIGLAGKKNAYIYDGKDENPYLGLLACADEIYVTNDSVNMMSEACASGKPVTILELEGHTNTKPARFANIVKEHKMSGDEMEKLAANVKQLLIISPSPLGRGLG